MYSVIKQPALLLLLGAVPFLLLQYLSKSSIRGYFARSQDPSGEFGCAPHQYSTEIVSQNPLLIYINGFMAEEEVAWLLRQGESRYERMLTYQGNSLSDKAVPDEGRTSSSAYLKKNDPVMACIGKRALDFHGGAQRALGDYGNPQLVKYEPSQKVNLHYDWWLEPQNRSGRLYNRRTTILAYLDDNCTQGETYFPLIKGVNDSATSKGGAADPKTARFWVGEDGQGLRFPPRRGNALFWVNLHENGTGDERTLHASLPVGEGKKVAMNFWPPQFFDLPN